MKYKRLSKRQIIISVDRLTRFKPTEEKYRRVFKDIIQGGLISPNLKKKELDMMSAAEIRDIAVKIFNNSFSVNSSDLSINNILKDYEKNICVQSADSKEFLNNNLDFVSAINLINDDTDILNLRWLKSLSCEKKSDRKKEKFLYPIEKVVLVEGITEEILLPVFAKIYGYDFNENGIKIIAAGGKNQVVKLYYRLSEEFKIPIFVLLDKDAESNEDTINTRLRSIDKVHLLDSGEFEDLLPKSLIVKTVNNEFKNFVSIKQADLVMDNSTVKALEILFKDKCLHEFKKADFAHQVCQNISSKSDLSEELVEIICGIKDV